MDSPLGPVLWSLWRKIGHERESFSFTLVLVCLWHFHHVWQERHCEWVLTIFQHSSQQYQICYWFFFFFFSRVKISYFRAKAHLVFYWCLYNKACCYVAGRFFPLQRPHSLASSWSHMTSNNETVYRQQHCENYDVKRETDHCYPRNVDRFCNKVIICFPPGLTSTSSRETLRFSGTKFTVPLDRDQ